MLAIIQMNGDFTNWVLGILIPADDSALEPPLGMMPMCCVPLFEIVDLLLYIIHPSGRSGKTICFCLVIGEVGDC